MADNQPNFLAAFKSSLDSLQQFNANLSDAVTKDKQDKDSFLQYVNSELGDINNKIKALEELINKINAELNNLRSASENNTTIISNNDSEKALLQQQLQQLQAAEAELRQQLAAAQQDASDKQRTIQQQIDEKEAQIVQLTAENASLKSQTDALNQQLVNRSQTDAEQTAAIQKMTEDNKQALEAQAAANAAQIQQLQQEIADKDAQITGINDTNSTGLASITAELEECKKGKAEIEKEIAEITAENNNLKEQIAEYEETIKNATATINEVVGSLNQLLTQIPQAQDRTTIAALFKEINDEIAKLTGLLSGPNQVVAPQQPIVQQPTVQQPPTAKPSTRLPDNTLITIDNQDVPLGSIRAMLKEKKAATYRIPDAENKYVKALAQVNAARSSVDVLAAIHDNGIVWRNGKVTGGRMSGRMSGRTKKRRARSKLYSTRKKQRGGFTYDKAHNLFGDKKNTNASTTSKSYKQKSSVARGRKSTRRTRR
jgi:chromosome segregation ATPase